MKLLKEKKVNYSVIAVLAVLSLVLSLIPILLLARYDAPYADDFSFSCETRAAIQAGEPFHKVIAAAAGKAADVYQTWQGTFTGILLMAFQPGIFGLSAYRFTAWIMLAALSAGVFLFFRALFTEVLDYPNAVSVLISSVCLLICIQLMPSANQGLYWYNGAVYYTFTFGLTLLTYAVAIEYIRDGGGWRILLMSVLAVIVGGSNYVTALLTVIVFLLITAGLALSGDGRWKGFLLPLVLVTAALIISAVAPGNAVRQAEYPDSPSAVKAILLSFETSLKHIAGWTDLPVLGMLIFCFPVLLHASDHSQIKCRHAAAFTLLSYCVYSAMFTPHLYAEGTPGPDRLINILYYSFIILSLINEAVWCSALRRFLTKRKGVSIGVFLGSVLAAGVLLGAGILSGKVHPTSVMALGELRNGEAEKYYSQILERQAVLEDSSVSDCVFEPFEETPYLLFFGDMSDDPQDYTNQDACTFYGKKSIIIALDNMK